MFKAVSANMSRAKQDIDQRLGLSDKFDQVMTNMNGTARIVGKEVDENLRVSDKERDVTNMALSSPSAVEKVTRSVVRSISSDKNPSSATNREAIPAAPRKLDFNNDDATVPSVVAMEQLDDYRPTLSSEQ